MDFNIFRKIKNTNNSKTAQVSGLKKIATSRKITPTKPHRQVCQTSSAETNSSCNTSCQSSEKPPKSPVNNKISNSTVDSGIDSTGHKKVSPQSSNTSTGSVLSGHVDMASELQRRCQQAAKLAFKEEVKEYKNKKNEMIKKKVEENNNNIVKSSRRPAIDLTEKETIESNNNSSIYKKKKKKQRLKSDQSHTRLNVEKVIHRAHSSEDLCQV